MILTNSRPFQSLNGDLSLDDPIVGLKKVTRNQKSKLFGVAYAVFFGKQIHGIFLTVCSNDVRIVTLKNDDEILAKYEVLGFPEN